MPFIIDTALQKDATKLQSFETREEKRKVELRQKLNEAKGVAESSLGAALVGFLHGHFEDADAQIVVPRNQHSCRFRDGFPPSSAFGASLPQARDDPRGRRVVTLARN